MFSFLIYSFCSLFSNHLCCIEYGERKSIKETWRKFQLSSSCWASESVKVSNFLKWTIKSLMSLLKNIPKNKGKAKCTLLVFVCPMFLSRYKRTAKSYISHTFHYSFVKLLPFNVCSSSIIFCCYHRLSLALFFSIYLLQ